MSTGLDMQIYYPEPGSIGFRYVEITTAVPINGKGKAKLLHFDQTAEEFKTTGDAFDVYGTDTTLGVGEKTHVWYHQQAGLWLLVSGGGEVRIFVKITGRTEVSQIFAHASSPLMGIYDWQEYEPTGDTDGDHLLKAGGMTGTYKAGTGAIEREGTNHALEGQVFEWIKSVAHVEVPTAAGSCASSSSQSSDDTRCGFSYVFGRETMNIDGPYA